MLRNRICSVSFRTCILLVLILSAAPAITFYSQSANHLESHLAHPGKSVKPPPQTWSDYIRQAALDGDMRSFKLAVIPQITCPNLVRVGTFGDVGKFVCNPARIATSVPCVVYSFGVGGDTSFEQYLYNLTKRKCKIICLDPVQQPASLFEPFNGTYLKKRVSNESIESNRSITVSDLMQKLSHTKIDVIKMDAEGAEVSTLMSFFQNADLTEDRLVVCQILPEFHWGFYPLTTWLRLFKTMEEAGYFLFAKEDNPFCDTCQEYSFIHRACMQDYGIPENVIPTRSFKDITMT